jgi:tetratricopeptide (TPR) repeat protein
VPLDISSKENVPLVKFLEKSRALILEPTSGNRTTIRRLLSALGMKTANVEAMELMGDARAKMESMKPNIVITELDVGGENGLELLEMLKKAYPNPLNAIFILLSSKNSSVITSLAAESDADALIIKPFTYATVESKFIEVLKTKASPTFYSKNVEEARLKLNAKAYGEAIPLLTEALKQDRAPALARYYLGVAYLEQNDFDHARQNFEEGLKAVPTHYKCLMGLFELCVRQKDYTKAYEVGTQVTKHHSLPPSRIPDFIRVAVMNQQFEEVTSLFEVVSSIENPEPVVVTYVSAGMVICGKLYLRRKDFANAFTVFQKAQKLAKARENIHVEIVSSLMNAGRMDEAEKALANIPPEIKDTPRMMVLELERLVALNSMDAAVTLGLKLVEKDLKCLDLYTLLIQKAKVFHFSPAVLGNIVTKGGTLFPEKKAELESLGSKV